MRFDSKWVEKTLLEKKNSPRFGELVGILANASFDRKNPNKVKEIAKHTAVFLVAVEDYQLDEKIISLFKEIFSSPKNMREFYSCIGFKQVVITHNEKGVFVHIPTLTLMIAEFFFKTPYESKGYLLEQIRKKFTVYPRLSRLTFNKIKIMKMVLSNCFLKRLGDRYGDIDLELFQNYVAACDYFWQKLRRFRKRTRDLLNTISTKVGLPESLVREVIYEFFGEIQKEEYKLVYIRDYQLVITNNKKASFDIAVKKNRKENK